MLKIRQLQWYASVFSAPWEAETGELQVEGQPR